MKKLNHEFYHTLLRWGICDSINGEIVMIEGKELIKAAKELASFKITYADHKKDERMRKRFTDTSQLY